MYNYTIIISQYYHTWHQFIVKHDKNFMDNAKNMAKELIKYKRDEEDQNGEYLGDLTYKFSDNRIHPRYNINDAGDIYFINCKTIDEAMYQHSHYIREEVRARRGYKRKAVLEDIDLHHQYKPVRNIVKKYFEIL